MNFHKNYKPLWKQALSLPDLKPSGINFAAEFMSGKPLLLKECLDVIDEDLIIDMKEEFSPKLPEDLNEMTTLENIRSDIFWVETLQPFLCAYPEDLKEKYGNELNWDFIKYINVLCLKKGNAEKCVTFEKSAEIYGILQGKMVEAGECDIANFNKPEWFKLF